MNVKIATLDFLDDPDFFTQASPQPVNTLASISPQKFSRGMTMGSFNPQNVMSGASNDMKSMSPDVKGSPEAKFNMQNLAKVKMIPRTLLTKPLPPEKLNQMLDDEKRLYTIQKGKYDTYMRILEKRKVQNDHPVDKRY